MAEKSERKRAAKKLIDNIKKHIFGASEKDRRRNKNVEMNSFFFFGWTGFQRQALKSCFSFGI